jgi:membrane protein YqaA with SNARE-associated domain
MHAHLSSLAAFLALSHTAAGAVQIANGSFHRGATLNFFSSLGLAGLFLIAVVNSTFVPLPVPGVADILVILYAATHMNPFFVVAIATLGSATGGLISHTAGSVGGMAFLRKHISPQTLSRITFWMESHPILTVALPAILPPPMPLWPFILAAGAVHMSRREFMWSFTLSRLLRHGIAAWLGVRYGSHVLHLWSRFNDRWADSILAAVWTMLGISLIFALWKLYRAAREFRSPPQPPSAKALSK